ncbi:uncharacterized protein LOC127802740 [Diospyros lotus]|uniref:uncharacterized protein LOC127802740 n=1 Tax=Diospyros lotus TaxID=55363 RepID=UPI002257540E|nr:uncharacterized protein LOC127802740 [Diospyros lotus]XP_052194705.1 uncharacterized protein LOC127802740 [Diospyros lotus]XP_052194706.1 uncharacterized protein LOC127802740 [Diospyros lotus]
MAAAEARVAWQRTANRCFVQEDAKRAPKLASCPSTSSTSKQVDAGSADTTDGHGNPNLGFMPHKWNHCYSNQPPESRWWLQLQHNYGYQKTSTHEQSNILEAEMEGSRADVSKPIYEAEEIIAKDGPDRNMNDEPSFGTYYGTSAVCMKKDSAVEKQDLKNLCSRSAQELLKSINMEESYELLELDPLGCSVSKQANEFSFDSDSPWIGSGKTVPWWRVADRDELASLVAQRSVNLIENCDLPQPQKTHVKTDPYSNLGHFDRNGIFPPSKDLKAQASVLSSPTVNRQGCSTLGSAYRKQWASSEEQIKDDPTCKGVAETHLDATPSKAELLEALRHSQTRAREAEMAAKQAHAEKEHILKLFFRQASHLFAYKQWFQLLQLENLYIQLKNNNQPISTLFPAVLPWTIHKTKKLQKSWHKTAKSKRGKRRNISKFTVAFALGFGLVGAGLLLGWTVGWMLPIF